MTGKSLQKPVAKWGDFPLSCLMSRDDQSHTTGSSIHSVTVRFEEEKNCPHLTCRLTVKKISDAKAVFMI